MADADYPSSWYAATRDSGPLRTVLAGHHEADVAVIGGGLAGLHTARLLALRGRRGCVLQIRSIAWVGPGRNGGFVGAGYAQRSGALLDQLGGDHARRLYAQSQRGVAVVRDAIEDLKRPDILMGSRKITVSRTDQGPEFPDRTRAL